MERSVTPVPDDEVTATAHSCEFRNAVHWSFNSGWPPGHSANALTLIEDLCEFLQPSGAQE